jgi:hypothetical protein
MGLAGLTAVFGMGTGVAPPVWSPESRPAGGQAGPGAGSVGSVTRGTLHAKRTHSGSLSDRIGPARERGGRIGVVKPLGC